MCGRFTLDPSKMDFKEFGVGREHYRPPARFNIAPTTGIAVIRQEETARELVEMRWGLLPSWAKPDSKLPLMINARADTIASKPAFRSAFKTRRCIVPATGYFEWKKLPDGTKQPFYFTRDETFAFAAIWEGETVATITTEPNKEAAQVHNRMPVIRKRHVADRLPRVS
jgi:putative SOS response-associated peptidase YedK